MQSRVLDTDATALREQVANSGSENVHLLRLPTGRRLAYSEFGERSGYPLFHCHSHGSSRLEAASLHKAARREGFRIIAIDRPGIGFSDPTKEASCRDFAIDLEQVAAQLRCQRYGMLACGGGLSYALAVAEHSPQQTSMVLGLSCSFPLYLESASPFQAALRAAAKSFVRFSIHLRHWRGSRSLSACVQQWVAAMSYADRQLFANPVMLSMIERNIAEALRQGAGGLAADSAAQFEPLGLDMEKLRLPCHFWYGSADHINARIGAERFSARLPESHVHELINRGRYFYWRHAEDVFSKANAVLGHNRLPVVHKADFTFRKAVSRTLRRTLAL